MTNHHGLSKLLLTWAIITIGLALTSNSIEESFAQKTGSVCTYKHLLLVYPNTNVTFVDNGTTKTYTGNMSAELKTTVTEAFKHLPNLIWNGSGGMVDSTYTIVEIARPITKITSIGNNYYWLDPNDIKPDLETYAPQGMYDSVHVIWNSGAYLGGPNTYFAMGGVFINNGKSTYDSTVAGATWWWSRTSDYVAEVFLHEWLHGVCRFYAGLGYAMPDYDADGADEHGYTESPTEGWMPYYRDLMTGKVWEPRLSKYTGITAQAWVQATPIPELPPTQLFAGFIAATLILTIFLHRPTSHHTRKEVRQPQR